MKISPARTAAFDILLKIEKDGAYSSALLPVYEEKLDPRDRALCHEIVLGVLRRKLYLDRVILQFNSKKLDAEVRIALQIGLYQLLFLDKVPDFSAINESVNLVQRAKKTSAKGFVNAILRKASKGVPELKYEDEREKLAVETSHPRWLIEKWIADFGLEETRKLAEANNERGRTVFRTTRKLEAPLTGNEDAAELNRLAAEGKIYFQDEGSQLVASAAEPEAGQRFLDVCAAPGGKTTAIAGSFYDAGNFIAAGDLHRHRLNTLRAACDLQGTDNVKVVQYDAAAALPFADESFDVVLVDAPCTGTGTIRSNPELRYLLQESDLAELSNKQLEILKNASKLVKRGGRLVYSTCSLEKEEGEEVVRNLLNLPLDLALTPPAVPARFLTKDGFGRTFPQRDDMDGFFIAAFEKK